MKNLKTFTIILLVLFSFAGCKHVQTDDSSNSSSPIVSIEDNSTTSSSASSSSYSSSSSSSSNSTPVANAGSDQSVAVGSYVTLNGSGSYDSDGDTISLTWSFTSKPGGSSAALSNTAIVNPLFFADVEGNYVVSLVVNDGENQSTTDLVTINVSSGVATLSWIPPTQNADGSPINVDDLTGYKIYYGTSSGSYLNEVDVGNNTNYIISNLSAGIYYFTVTAYDADGNESSYSNEVSKTV